MADNLKLSSISSSFTVNDVARSLAWYQDVLGFEVGERWEMEGQLRGVELKAGSAVIMLGQDDWKKGRDRAKGQGVRLYFMTDQDVDLIADRIRKAGGQLAQEPRDEQWGNRTLAVNDPDGYAITIAGPLKKA